MTTAGIRGQSPFVIDSVANEYFVALHTNVVTLSALYSQVQSVQLVRLILY